MQTFVRAGGGGKKYKIHNIKKEINSLLHPAALEISGTAAQGGILYKCGRPAQEETVRKFL